TFHQEGGHHFNDTTNGHNDQAHHEHPHGTALDPAVPVATFGLRYLGFHGRCFGILVGYELTRLHGHPHVVYHHQCAAQVERSSHCAQPVRVLDLEQGVQEVVVYQVAIRSELLPHQALGEACEV